MSEARTVTRYERLTRRLAEGLAVFLFAVVLLLQALNILLRYTGLHPPLMWVEELSTFSFIWILYLLWHLNDRDDEHFKVDVLLDRLSPLWRCRLEALAHLLALLFAGIVVWASVQFIPTTMLYRTNSFDWLPMGVIYLVIPVGFVLVAIERLRLLRRALRRSRS
jgi:TRAP-type C4-dicarboxylate transport system permease small subunit